MACGGKCGEIRAELVDGVKTADVKKVSGAVYKGILHMTGAYTPLKGKPTANTKK